MHRKITRNRDRNNNIDGKSGNTHIIVTYDI